MEFFHSQEIEILHNQGTFPVKEFFHSQRIFPQKILLNQGSFPQTSKFSIVKEIFHTENLLDQGNFLQTRKFSKNFFFFDQGTFPQRFLHNQKKFLQTKIKNVL